MLHHLHMTFKAHGNWELGPLKIHSFRLPWWFSGQESAWQCSGHGSYPWSGKIPYAAEQLSLCGTTTKPSCYNFWSPCSAEKKPPQWEAHALSTTRIVPVCCNWRKPSRSNKDPAQPKISKQKFLKKKKIAFHLHAVPLPTLCGSLNWWWKGLKRKAAEKKILKHIVRTNNHVIISKLLLSHYYVQGTMDKKGLRHNHDPLCLWPD